MLNQSFQNRDENIVLKCRHITVNNHANCQVLKLRASIFLERGGGKAVVVLIYC